MECLFKIPLPRQEEITRAVCELLTGFGWKILGSHHPGASGGIRLSSRQKGPQKRPRAIIPDIIAVRKHQVLIVESATRFTLADVTKLRRVVETDDYLDDIQQVAGLGSDTCPEIVPGIAFVPSGNEPDLEGIVVFHYINGKIHVANGINLLR